MDAAFERHDFATWYKLYSEPQRIWDDLQDGENMVAETANEMLGPAEDQGNQALISEIEEIISRLFDCCDHL
jgi:hypothetical protein